MYIRMKRIIVYIIGLMTGLYYAQAEPFRVVSYNVENLFHPAHDSLKDDWEWTPGITGKRKISLAC